MGNFSQKIDKFIEIFIEQNGYTRVVEGLQNTLLIAVCGLIIGILIGTVIATVRVLPKYKVLPRVLNGICSFYVALFRGTPMVVQLLVFYYVLLPIIGWNIKYHRGTGVDACVWIKQRRVHIRDHEERHPVRGSGTDGSRTGSGTELWREHVKDRDPAGSEKHPSHTGK